MKKKVKLQELSVKSFVTQLDDSMQIKGGTMVGTEFSCYQYISCNPAACTFTYHPAHCDGGSIVIQRPTTAC